jgi:hypothetical protein
MIDLQDVTLIAVSSVKIPETIHALTKSCEQISFGSVKLISDFLPLNLPVNITFEKCPKLNSLDDYSYYVFRELYQHVNTSHCLLIQWDGFILHPELWDNSWLSNDYIGAPWQESPSFISQSTGEMVRVGNGGFSLRSKKLLEIPNKYNLVFGWDRGYANEDGLLCSYYRKEMLDLGIKYAPLEVACRFSHELDIPENINIPAMFGFHKHPR